MVAHQTLTLLAQVRFLYPLPYKNIFDAHIFAIEAFGVCGDLAVAKSSLCQH